MTRAWSGATIACMVLVAVMGCRAGGQVLEIKDAPVLTASGKVATIDQVQKAIIDAGIKQQWIMTVVKPGEILGEFNIQSHTIHVTIPYTSNKYSILYKDSSNLRYDPVKRTIHVNYAIWIQRLDTEIRARLSTAGM